MLEQQLINAFMKLTAKAGAGEIVRDLIHQVEENGNPKIWTPLEMERAIHFINHSVENFGKHEAVIVINSLMHKFDISVSDVSRPETIHDNPGIQGLQ